MLDRADETAVRTWWTRFVDSVALVWVALFVVDLGATAGVLVLAPVTRSLVESVLRSLLVVFLLDVYLLYRWSAEDVRTFLRTNWLYVLTVVPWFRPLRALRAGRGIRVLRLLARSRRAGSLLNKLRRTGRRLWNRAFD